MTILDMQYIKVIWFHMNTLEHYNYLNLPAVPHYNHIHEIMMTLKVETNFFLQGNQLAPT